MPLKVGVTSGIYYAARAAELATSVKKLGYGLTRGSNCMEIPIDVAHEITFTQGRDIRHIAEKQGMEVLIHGDLQVPMGMPERGEWRDAHDRITKSIRSAVYAGASYIDFHACLTVWLELITYAGRKLTMSFCDHEGKFISHILQESKDLRDWFVKYEKIEDFTRDILTKDERIELNHTITIKVEKWRKEETEKKVREALEKMTSIIQPIVDLENKRIEIQSQGRLKGDVTINDKIEDIINDVIVRGLAPHTGETIIDKKMRDVMDSIREDAILENTRIERDEVDKLLLKKLRDGKDWYFEEIRGGLSVIEGYHIMAHYMFYTKDPIWMAMADEYSKVLKEYKLNYDNKKWLDQAWKKSNQVNDRKFKEFFYAVVCAKFLEGHMKKAFEWIDKSLIPDLRKLENRKESAELIKYARNLIIGIENPEAREPQYGGLHLMWRPKQIYATVKTARKTIGTKKLMMIMDHEHLATQGVDALTESREQIMTKSDFGELCISIHANHPNPLHPHEPIELGDIVLYELLYNLRKTGLGKKRQAYLIFERGGGDDPFQKSIDSLRLMAKFLEKEVHPDVLPLEFYGLETGGGAKLRQEAIISDHKMEPLKDLFEFPEEDWGILSKAARDKQKAEVFKKGELR